MYRKHLLGRQSEDLLNYISSLSYDINICKEIKMVVATHVLELLDNGHIERETASKIIKALCEAPCEYEGFEDIHEAIEFFLKERIGEDAYWQNLGKSRNDQVITAIRMKVREEMISLLLKTLSLVEKLLQTIKEKGQKPFVLNTHFQPAQPSTFGHYLSSFVEQLLESVEIGFDVLSRVNLSPLGSGAVAGSTVPLNRVREASRLCFEGLLCNSLYATHSRDFFIDVFSFLIRLSSSFKRIANDLFYLSHPLIKAISIPREHLATSSMMPHKANPATMEVLRARLDRIMGLFVSFYSTYTSLTSGYNLDMQELTPLLWEAIGIVSEAVDVLASLIPNLDVGEGVEKLLKMPITASDKAEEMSLKLKIPFRRAYYEVADKLKRGELSFSIGDSLRSIERRVSEGSPGNYYVCVERAQQKVILYRSKAENLLNALRDCERRLLNEIEKLINARCSSY